MSVRVGRAVLVFVLLSSSADATRSPSVQSHGNPPKSFDPIATLRAMSSRRWVVTLHRDIRQRSPIEPRSFSLSLSACVSGEGVLEGADGISEEERDGHGADAAADRHDASARANPAGL